MQIYSRKLEIATLTKAGFLAASFGLTASTSAFGDICSDYATDAVAANKRAVVMGCGFAPPVWSNSYQSHHKWCLHGANATSAPAETAKRATALQTCQVSFCRTYALDAVDANQKAAALGCGFKPPAWSNNHQNHYDWCMLGDNPLRAGRETRARATKLASCKAAQPPAPKPGKNAACDLYANEALRVAASASALGCGFSGPRWVQSYSVHYDFCTAGANPVILLAEAAARDHKYKACQAKAGAAVSGAGANWVFADSNKRRLTQADLSGLSKAVLWQARNEIFARKGLIFTTAKAKNFFGQKPWYQPTTNSVSLNAVEQANVALIRSFE